MSSRWLPAMLVAGLLPLTPLLSGTGSMLFLPPAAAKRELPPLTVAGRSLKQFVAGPAIVLLSSDDDASTALHRAWLEELRKIQRNERARRVLQPRLYVVEVGRCTPRSDPDVQYACAAGQRVDFALPARFVVATDGRIRGFAEGESNFRAGSVAREARYLWMIARSDLNLAIIDTARRW